MKRKIKNNIKRKVKNKKKKIKQNKLQYNQIKLRIHFQNLMVLRVNKYLHVHQNNYLLTEAKGSL